MLSSRFLSKRYPRIDNSSSSHRPKLDGEVCDFWFHDLLVITITYLNSIGVRSGFEHDVVLLRQVLVTYVRKSYRFPKGGIAPIAQSGNSDLNSSSFPSETALPIVFSAFSRSIW